MTALYIIATSERPDAYINTIAYAIEHRGVSSVHFLVISEHDYKEDVEEGTVLASTVAGNVSRQLTALSEGKYFRTWTNTDLTSISLHGSDWKIYSRCLDTLNRSGTTGRVIPLSKLDDSLREIAASGKRLIDVSALKKNLLVDVVATLLSIGFQDVYSFELRKAPTFDEDDLYHNLKHGDDFLFRNLATSESVKRSLKRIGRWNSRVNVIVLVTVLLALVASPVSYFLKDSPSLMVLNTIASILGISSFLLFFIRNR